MSDALFDAGFSYITVILLESVTLQRLPFKLLFAQVSHPEY